MTYQPAPQTQLTGGAYQYVNCTWACATLDIDRHTVARLRIGPDKLRSLSGDTSGGSTYNQNADTVSKATGGKVVLAPRYSLTRSQVRDYIAGGRAASIGILCSVTITTTRRTSTTYKGNHSIFVNAYHWIPASTVACTCELATKVAHAEYDVCDVGHSLTYLKFQRWSAALLYKAAEAHGGGGVNDPVISLLLTRDTEGVTRTAVEAGRLFASASSTSTVVASFASGKAFTVTSTASGGGVVEPDGQTRKGWHKTAAGYATGRALQ